MQRIIEKLQTLKSADPRLADLMASFFVPKSFKKGVLLSMPDYSYPILYFIEEGLVRGYFVNGEEERTAWVIESGFFLPSTGFFSNGASIEYVSFLKDSQTYALNLIQFDEQAAKSPGLYRMLLEIYEEHILEGKVRENMLRIHLAEQRYLYFKDRHPRLTELLSHDVLASYLSIDSKYLFFIKKKYF